MPRTRPLTIRILALAATGASAPVCAATGPGLAQGALWFTLGAAVAVAAVMLVSSRVLRERVAPRSSWLPYAGIAGLVVIVGAALSCSRPGWAWPWPCRWPAGACGWWTTWRAACAACLMNATMPAPKPNVRSRIPNATR
ncbi:hypothetical protein [Arenimonas daejeonensis]|uniref:hypothetical protein n=1 Tax=Arenimonas daejeonensis TaxID=370777 RepID=UPI0011BD7168|nr:hypothetical protein [Arenimonas daejeonensis]